MGLRKGDHDFSFKHVEFAVHKGRLQVGSWIYFLELKGVDQASLQIGVWF